MSSGIKLIIWDLDGIIWSESLAESNTIGTVNQVVLDFIKQSESNGIIHSICSKNNYITTELELKRLGIWDYFVFPKISYLPKGPLVKTIIEECQLREENVIFVDDNSINLNEVKFYSPKIQTSINTSFIDTFDMPIGKSRTSQYRILENKLLDKVNQSNMDFLKNSDINVAFYLSHGLGDGMEYYDRVAELLNRSNQLNYTKSRIEPHENMPYANYQNTLKYYVFVWDKYGYYGLVGIFSSDVSVDFKSATTFAFSCRIMNMGIENFCSQYIKNKLGWNQDYSIENDGDYSYITLHNYKDVHNYIREQESMPQIQKVPTASLSACCHTGILIGFSGIDHMIKISEMPLNVENFDINTEPDLIVVSSTNFLIESNDPLVIDYVKNLYTKIKASNKKMLFLIPNIVDFTDDNIKRVYDICCSIIDNKNVYKLEVPINNDYYHWDRKTLHEVSGQIKDWILSQSC